MQTLTLDDVAARLELVGRKVWVEDTIGCVWVEVGGALALIDTTGETAPLSLSVWNKTADHAAALDANIAIDATLNEVACVLARIDAPDGAEPLTWLVLAMGYTITVRAGLLNLRVDASQACAQLTEIDGGDCECWAFVDHEAQTIELQDHRITA